MAGPYLYRGKSIIRHSSSIIRPPESSVMSTLEAVRVVILAAIVANLILVAGLVVASRMRARRAERFRQDVQAEIGPRPSPIASPTDARAASPAPSRAVPPSSFGALPWADSGEAIPTDPVTGFDLPAGWARRLADESARIQRYGRTSTIVLVELAGLDRLAERLGTDAAERLIAPIGSTMRRLARSADNLARLGPTRFAVLLPDTDEVKAINYVERVRGACDVWLEAGAVSLRLAMGWAEISASQGADVALHDAERRLAEERQRQRSREDRDADDDRDVVAAMQPAQAN
jgi:diguanylate cyclase (GGDEF)-like protein